MRLGVIFFFGLRGFGLFFRIRRVIVKGLVRVFYFFVGFISGSLGERRERGR